MNILFKLNNCDMCLEVKTAILQVNSVFPLQQIEVVDIFEGDPRTAILEELFESEDLGKWSVPVLVVEKRGIASMFNSYLPVNKNRKIIYLESGYYHYTILLSNLFS